MTQAAFRPCDRGQHDYGPIHEEGYEPENRVLVAFCSRCGDFRAIPLSRTPIPKAIRQSLNDSAG